MCKSRAYRPVLYVRSGHFSHVEDENKDYTDLVDWAAGSVDALRCAPSTCVVKISKTKDFTVQTLFTVNASLEVTENSW